jgi:hypothetical protein
VSLMALMLPATSHAALATPAEPIAVAGTDSATVFVAKASGTAPTSVVITSDPDGQSCTISSAYGACVVTGLTAGTSYTFTAVASRSGEVPATSPVSDAVIPGVCAVGVGDFPLGTGTSADPFQIATAAQLVSARKYNRSCSYKLTADISLSGEWVPIGMFDPNEINHAGYSGTFDGNDKTISGMVITTALGRYLAAGLFGLVEDGQVSDLSINGSITRSDTDGSHRWQGVLAGTMTGASTITNVHVTGSNTGGLVLGGLVGWVGRDSEVIDSSADVTVQATYVHAWNVGGLVGRAQDSCAIRGSWATGTITGYSFTGGLVGGIWPSSLGSCVIEESYATGDVVGNKTSTGGLVGLVNKDALSTEGAIIRNSFASGDVSSGNADFGGLIGKINPSDNPFNHVVVNSYATGDISYFGTGSPVNAGGLIGRADTGTGTAVITNSYWNPTDAGATAVAAQGTQATQAEMMTYSMYENAGWSISTALDRSKTWLINSSVNSGYPFPMRRVTTPPTPTITWSPQGLFFMPATTVSLAAATTGSDSNITYAVTSGANCSVDLNTPALTYTATGTCVITASTAATSAYSSASTAVTVTISPAPGGGSGGGSAGGGSAGGGSAGGADGTSNSGVGVGPGSTAGPRPSPPSANPQPVTFADAREVPPSQVSGLTPEQVASIPAAQFKDLPLDVFAVLTAAQVTNLPTELIRAIRPQRVASLQPEAVAGMSGEQLSSLQLPSVRAMSPEQIGAISPEVISTVEPAFLAQLKPKVLAAMDPSVIATLSPQQAAAIRPAALARLPIASLRQLDPDTFAALSVRQLRKLTPRQVSQLTVDQLDELTPVQRQALRRS